jgi:hypothetical protein
MSDSTEYEATHGGGGGDPGSPVEVPFGQRLYDNAFFWLVAGFAVMAIVYTGWGLIEIMRLPQAPLP